MKLQHGYALYLHFGWTDVAVVAKIAYFGWEKGRHLGVTTFFSGMRRGQERGQPVRPDPTPINFKQ